MFDRLLLVNTDVAEKAALQYNVRSFDIIIWRGNEETVKKKAKTFYTLFFLAAVFFAIFVLLELRSDYLTVIGAGVVVLISAYLLLDKISEENSAKNNSVKDNTENGAAGADMAKEICECIRQSNAEIAASISELEKINKAIYTVNKHANDEQTDEFAAIRTDIQSMIEKENELLEHEQDAFNGQKNALKALIKYNKENARQIAENANANNRALIEAYEENNKLLLEKLEELSDRLGRMPAAPAISESEKIISEPDMVMPEPDMVMPEPDVVMPEPGPDVVIPEPEPEVIIPEPGPDIAVPEPEIEIPEPEPDIIIPVPEPEMALSEPEETKKAVEPEPDNGGILDDEAIQKLLAEAAARNEAEAAAAAEEPWKNQWKNQ